jgi:4-amino-4-deoxy-L-arabinose transferase-like glycosyltransferase
VATAAAEAFNEERAGQPARGLTTFAAALSVFLLAFRLLAGSNGPLFFDEAYYWQWSTNLQLGYFDHPPLIAWFVRAGTLIFGDTPLGIRLMPSLSATLCVLTVWAIAHRLTGDDRVAAWAAIFANLTGIMVLSFVAWPDAPMVLAWLVAFYELVVVYRGGAPAWWLLAGVMIGVAGASKYIALLLALGLFA